MNETNVSPDASSTDKELRTLVRDILQEYSHINKEIHEPAYKVELSEERRRREHLERRVNELEEENRKTRQFAEETHLHSAIKGELQAKGIAKVDLAFKAIKDDISRDEDGQLVGVVGKNSVPLSEYVEQFCHANPELLPARLAGGAGAAAPAKGAHAQSTGIDLDRIRPGMDARDLERIREEVAKVALQALSGR